MIIFKACDLKNNAILKKVIVNRRQSMNSYIQRGQEAIQNKNIPEAVLWFTKAVTENPKDAQIKAYLGQSLCWMGKSNEGVRHLRDAGQLLCKKARKSRDVQTALDLAQQLHYWNDYPGALELLKQVVQISPDSVNGFHLLALTNARLNHNKAALAAGRQALKLDPDNATRAIFLAELETTDGQKDSAKKRLEKVFEKPLLTAEEQFRAHKEMARVLDKLGEYAFVFKHLHAAGQLSHRLPEVKRQNSDLLPDKLVINKATFDRESMGRWSDKDFPVELPAPVFLVGFMRTGTTLTQEILGAHPKVFVADETDLIHGVVQELNKLSRYQGSIPEQLRTLDWEAVVHLRAFYWDKARSMFGAQLDQRLFLDKTTMNSIDIGLINTLFPDAKLVFLVRDPRDVCLSCFMQTMIPTPATIHLLTWEKTAQFYAQVMDWWLKIKPELSLKNIELRYEDAVTDFESTFRTVFDFLGLDWDPAVANFHQKTHGKFIASPSFNQVAQPLYVSSIGRWQRYAAEYASIYNTLQPLIKAFGYDAA